MEPIGVQIAILMLVLAVGLMITGFPVAVTMLIGGFLGMCLIRGFGPATAVLGYVTWDQSLNQILVIIPLFTWMGVMAAKGGISGDAFTSLYKWVGQFRGGLAMAVSAACAAFGAVCGNHIATAVAMTRIALPEMRKYNYQDGFSVGSIAASGNLGIMIPPSGAFILYGFITQTSIRDLFIAGILPGVFVLILFCIQIAVQTRLNPRLGPAGPNLGWIDRLKSTYLLLPIAAVFLIVMGGIYRGIFTPTEAACFGCFAVLVVGVARRRLNVKGLIQSLKETLPVAAMIMLMLICAWIFAAMMTASGLPNTLTSYIAGLEIDRYLVLALMMVIYLVAGTIMDIYGVLVITLPIFFPIVLALGFNPIHFGVLCVLCIMAGSISPPFGILVYAVHGLNRDVPMFAIFRGVLPFFVTLVVSIFVIMFLPQLATFLLSS
ncbi:MAG: TRAP transporter large permease [Dehalococcoidia bacterium]|nr:TRAP transporter large permease [Dehalococcoidia bacterium]MDH4299305.1 TRAP transporter large permease [Dehalococcoidia bacterium]MDH4366895.1 TRAP transporter large permease [Dehalococcoidia bacterium]